jgi:hypothetical protein
MAIARRAEPADLPVPATGARPQRAVTSLLRRWLPISIGAVMAAAMVVVAAAPPLIAPLSPSAQFSDAVLKGPGRSSAMRWGRTSSGGTS